MDDQKHAQPLVTVVLPTADRPSYLEEALRSAIGQSYRNIEILVRDNASGPETAEIVRRFPDERVHYLRHEQNIGMTPNVLGAFREAKGKYVTNLHDDDFWEPDFLEKTVAVLEANSDVVLAFSDHYIVNQGGEIDPEATKRTTAIFKRAGLAPGIHKPFKKLALIDFSVPLAMASVLRRDSIDWDDFPNLVSTYDLWLVYLACRNGEACYYLPERLTSYRIHSASESALGRVRLNKAFIEIYKRMLLDPRVAEFHRIFRKRLGIHHTDAAIALLRRGDHAGAREMLTGGMRYRFDIKANLAYAASFLPRTITRHLPGKLSFPVPQRYLDYIGTNRGQSIAAC